MLCKLRVLESSQLNKDYIKWYEYWVVLSYNYLTYQYITIAKFKKDKKRLNMHEFT